MEGDVGANDPLASFGGQWVPVLVAVEQDWCAVIVLLEYDRRVGGLLADDVVELDDLRTRFRWVDDCREERPELLPEVLVPSFDIAEKRDVRILLVEDLRDVVTASGGQ